ncbi:MAG: hypothetical protein KUA38_14825, partial [Hydrogenophaga sp.]|nr:hypothetical protein [Hydrogenophaga sp.]
MLPPESVTRVTQAQVFKPSSGGLLAQQVVGLAERLAVVQGLPVAGEQLHQRLVQGVDINVQRLDQALRL